MEANQLCGRKTVCAQILNVPNEVSDNSAPLHKYYWSMVSDMKLLAEIYRVPGMNLQGRTITRKAMRGIIFRETELLMIHASQNGTCKFPGGGVMAGETHPQALTREVREECGMELSSIGAAFGKVIEYAPAIEQDYEVFRMTSYYYYCQVQPAVFAQRLDAYELEMGFKPIWIRLDEALERNKAAAATDPGGKILWNRREIFVLELLRNLKN